MSSKPTLGYWNIRALAQPIRYLLVIAEVDFIDKRYPFGEGNTFAEIESIGKYWRQDKENLGLDFPNLPYYIDGDVKVVYLIIIVSLLLNNYDFLLFITCY